jgi:nitrogen regulatory protein PII
MLILLLDIVPAMKSYVKRVLGHIKRIIKEEELLPIQVAKQKCTGGCGHEFIQVNGIRQRQEKIKIAFEPGRFEETPAPLTNFSVVTDDHDVEERICQILKGQPSYILFSKEDWRLPGFFTVHGDFLAIGGDSYLAWFLRQNTLKN